MIIEFLEPAETEFAEAIAYWNEQRAGLGFELATEVKRTLARIRTYPHTWPKLSSRTRHCRTDRFPYSVIYQLREETILIVAIMHFRRHPDTWKNRISSGQE